MPRLKSKRFCAYLDEHVDVTVHYTIVSVFGTRSAVPTGVECSASFNGRCGKCETCLALKEAQDDVRSKTVQ